MTDAVTLKPATAGDFDWIVDRHATVYTEEFSLSAAFGERIALRMAELRARTQGFVEMTTAWVGDARAGFICVSDLPDNGAFLNFVWVEQSFRKRGIAEALMQHALEQARAQNCTFVRLKTFSVLAAARRLYGRFGFEIDEVEKDSSDFGPVFDVEYWRMPL